MRNYTLRAPEGDSEAKLRYFVYVYIGAYTFYTKITQVVFPSRLLNPLAFAINLWKNPLYS